LLLITGMAGFIGFHLTKKLLKEGFSICGIDNLNNYYSPKLKIDRLKELGFFLMLLAEMVFLQRVKIIQIFILLTYL